MEPFRLLAGPKDYVACDWDLTADKAGRDYWIAHFREHYKTLRKLIAAEYSPPADSLAAFEADYLALIGRLADEPERFGRVTIITLDTERDKVLRRYGFPDPFRHVKARETEAALLAYPKLIAELDGQDEPVRLDELIAGVFAGNIFDLGAMATLRRYRADNGIDFFRTRAELSPRPWLIDDAGPMAAAWSAIQWRYRKALFLVDNAGCDFVLGCLPLIREFACRRGADVVVACNSGPSLNDILVDEAKAVLADARRADPLLDAALSAGNIRIISSGNTAPLIDLSCVSDELNAEAAGADLLVIEGMGRSIESNFHARFTVDTAKMALLKDAQIAARLGGGLFDVVCKFERAN